MKPTFLCSLLFLSWISFLCPPVVRAAVADCAAENQADVSFDTPSLKGKKCTDLDRDYCLFTAETKTKCPCNCKKLLYGDQNGDNGDEKGPDKSTDRSGKKGKGKHKKGKKFCFHADDTVLTESGGRLSMKELLRTPDVRVLTGQDYSSVRYWLHAEEETTTTFLALSTSTGHRLRISSEHLMYRFPTCHPDHMDTVYARRLAPGHCVRVYDHETNRFVLTPIVNITTELATGIYAPITHEGSIVVNDVLASCYTTFEDEQVQKAMIGVLLDARDFLESLGGPLRWIGELMFGERTESTAVAPVPMFVHTLLDLSKYFVH